MTRHPTPKLENLIRLAERQAFGPSTQALIDEAVSRDIPYIRLNDQSLVQLGQGQYQQRIRATIASRSIALVQSSASGPPEARFTLTSSAEIDALSGAPVGAGFDWLGFTVAAALLAGQPLWGCSGETWLWLAAITLGPQILGHTVFNWALKYVDASLISGTILAEPVVAALLALNWIYQVARKPAFHRLAWATSTSTGSPSSSRTAGRCSTR